MLANAFKSSDIFELLSITFENFNKGMQILANDTEKEHKLTFKHVKGGVILADTDFSIK